MRLAVTLFVKAGLSLMGTNWVIIPIMGERLFPVHIDGFTGQQASTMGMSILLASRGAGALVGAFACTSLAGSSRPRLRLSILGGFGLGAAGYLMLSGSPNIWMAFGALMIAHAGGSIIWVASTTLLQQQTEDRFRGRVFSAEFAFSMATLAVVSYASGILVDHGISVRVVAFATGLVMLLPGFAWLAALRLWKRE